MGISWSGRRRQNNNYHYPPPLPPPPGPPPPPPPPPPHYYSSDSPPLPPPAPPHSYVYANTSTPYPAPHNLYSTHPPPPAPAHYYSCGYGASNYGNSMMGRVNYHPYYANQASGWPGIRPPMGQQQQQLTTPPPYVEHQNAKKVRNDVNVHKHTLRLEVDEQNPDQHLVSFVFDALFDGSITIFYFAKEEPNCKFVPLYPDVYMPVKIPFQKGRGQKFHQPSGTGIDLGFFVLDDLAKPSQGEDVYPLVISAETSLPLHSVDEHEHVSETAKDTSPHKQITQAVLEKNNGENFKVRVIRQILWIDEVRYELRELYGIGSSAVEGFDDNDPGKECVICMTEPKDTAIIPCRHMCMCRECANELRLQSNKCPICRQPIEELIEIKINNGDG